MMTTTLTKQSTRKTKKKGGVPWIKIIMIIQFFTGQWIFLLIEGGIIALAYLLINVLKLGNYTINKILDLLRWKNKDARVATMLEGITAEDLVRINKENGTTKNDLSNETKNIINSINTTIRNSMSKHKLDKESSQTVRQITKSIRKSNNKSKTNSQNNQTKSQTKPIHQITKSIRKTKSKNNKKENPSESSQTKSRQITKSKTNSQNNQTKSQSQPKSSWWWW